MGSFTACWPPARLAGSGPGDAYRLFGRDKLRSGSKDCTGLPLSERDLRHLLQAASLFTPSMQDAARRQSVRGD
jgi:hypothetical protein